MSLVNSNEIKIAARGEQLPPAACAACTAQVAAPGDARATGARATIPEPGEVEIQDLQLE